MIDLKEAAHSLQSATNKIKKKEYKKMNRNLFAEFVALCCIVSLIIWALASVYDFAIN